MSAIFIIAGYFTVIMLWTAYQGVWRRHIALGKYYFAIRRHAYYLNGIFAVVYGVWALLLAAVELGLLIAVSATGESSINTPFGNASPISFLFVGTIGTILVEIVCLLLQSNVSLVKWLVKR